MKFFKIVVFGSFHSIFLKIMTWYSNLDNGFVFSDHKYVGNDLRKWLVLVLQDDVARVVLLNHENYYYIFINLCVCVKYCK